MAIHHDLDAIIIGAGLSGIYSLIRMRELGLRTRILENAAAVGGAWFWNQYPGARFDSESDSYGYSFSKDILDEWHWKERFSPQPETLKYINFVCDKFDLRKDIQFNTQVVATYFHEETASWVVTDEKGREYTTKYLITAMGPFTKPTLPNIVGVNDFTGEAYHTSRWPQTPVDFQGKRVAIVGVGATGIQTIQEISKVAGNVVVFQRTPNWTAPLRNSKISLDEMAIVRKGYPEVFKRCMETPNCFIHSPDPRKTYDVSSPERETFWESLYMQPGFAIWLANFHDIHTDQQANDAFSEFMAKKIRQSVHDPKTAEKLVPKCHGFGTRRVALETSYYDAYNQENVKLVDLLETPIERITPRGIRMAGEEHEFDIIIYATGFDAITGAFDAIDFQGRHGVKLKDKWQGGPKTFLGMTVEDFPNMFMVMGPHQPIGNATRNIEFAVDWVAELVNLCVKTGVKSVEATPEGVDWWTKHVYSSADRHLASKVDSWMTGVNKNLPGKQKRIITRYTSGAVEFRMRCNEVAADSYKQFRFT